MGQLSNDQLDLQDSILDLEFDRTGWRLTVALAAAKIHLELKQH